MRYHPSRFVATLVAIAISVAFMAGSSVIVATEQNGLERQQALPIAGADVVAEVDYEANSAQVGKELADLPEVAAAEASLVTGDGLKNGTDFAYLNLIGLPSEPFRWSHLVDGRSPERAGEIALTRGAAAGLKVAVGDTLGWVGLHRRRPDRRTELALLQTGYLAREAFARHDLDPDAGTGSWLVRGKPNVELERVVEAVKAALPAGTKVDSAATLRAKAIEDLTDGFEAFRTSVGPSPPRSPRWSA